MGSQSSPRAIMQRVSYGIRSFFSSMNCNRLGEIVSLSPEATRWARPMRTSSEKGWGVADLRARLMTRKAA